MSRLGVFVVLTLIVLGGSLAWAVSFDYRSIPHQTLGAATATVQGVPPNEQLFVSNIGSSGQDGVVADLLDIPGVTLHEGIVDFDLNVDQQKVEIDYDFLNLTPMMIRMQEVAARTPPKLYVADSPGETVDVELLLNDTQVALLLDRAADGSTGLVESDGLPSDFSVEVKEEGEHDVLWSASFELSVNFELLPAHQPVVADKIIVKRKRNGGNKAAAPGVSIRSVSMTAQDIPSFTILGESYSASSVVPAVRSWGIIAATVLIAGGATVVMQRRRQRQP